MHLRYILLAAAFAFLSSSEALTTATDVKHSPLTRASPPEFMHSLNVIGDELTANRILRAREVAGDPKDDEDERTLPKLNRAISDLPGNSASTVAKLARSNSVNAINDLAVIKTMYASQKVTLKGMFEQIATGMKVDPKVMSERLGMPQKLKTMTMGQLVRDRDFRFWRMFTKYWNKHHFQG
ncbi:hypothetical protein PHYPSEUDO_009971 [Phytophthora pseudosyringae]|uniref:RxLR effector protein n=1 Tax=Phytophthora pseudosyringae TaxID=221518 RepID=A0A8T1VE92_9STRA|nr:hypothetical protein PHYPSEUDO_009971 [Phytophthora pseudosyringae]